MTRARVALGPVLVFSFCAGGCAGGDGGSEATTGGVPAAIKDVDAVGALVFEDVTPGSGLASFVHETGGFGSKRLPETMGSGAVLLDFDGDENLDLFLVNGTGWPDAPDDPPRGTCSLYRGNGDCTFTDVSVETGTAIEVYGMGCAAADFDADGDPDIYVTTLGDDLLLRNDGGVFVDVAAAAGVGRGRWRDTDGNPHPEWTTACLWLDADGDGILDLFVAGYCEWTPEIDIFATLDGVEKAFTTPDRYHGLPCRLYRGRGDGSFAEWSFTDGPPTVGKALGAATWDLSGDGLPEILVANDTRPNFLFESRRGGLFREIGTPVGFAYDEFGRARAGMGIDVAEFGTLQDDVGTNREDGPVVAIGNFAEESATFQRLLHSGFFRSEAQRVGIAGPTFLPLAFGLVFLDLDLDGWIDLLVANGHIEPDIARHHASQSHAQPPQLFGGGPDGIFANLSDDVGADFRRPLVARSVVWGDLDGDGDLDLILTQNGGPPVVLRNRVQENHHHHYLRVKLRGRGPNRDSLGARVELRAGRRTQVRAVHTGSSYLGHGELTLTFGLGTLDRVEHLSVRWPTGTTQAFEVPHVDRTLLLVEE